MTRWSRIYQCYQIKTVKRRWEGGGEDENESIDKYKGEDQDEKEEEEERQPDKLQLHGKC